MIDEKEEEKPAGKYEHSSIPVKLTKYTALSNKQRWF